MAKDYYYRNFQETEDIGTEERKITVFKNTVNTLNNRISANGHYATWFKFKYKDFEIDTSSNDPNRQFMTSFRHELTGAGQANKFILNIAYDPFKYGQEPSASLSKIEEYFCSTDNVIAKTIDNVKSSNRYEDTSGKIYGELECKFQYGYSAPINMVSPIYTACISSFLPNIIDGIISYTIEGISGTAFISGGDHSKASFQDRKNAKPLKIVKYELWRYFGDPNNIPKDEKGKNLKTPEDETLTEKSCVNNSGILYDIDIPDELLVHSKPMDVSGSGGSVSPMSYIQDLLNQAIDDRYEDEMSPDSENADSRPFYNVTVTDSEPKKISVSLVRPHVKDNEKLTPETNKRVTGITFNWMNQTNSIVTKWTPKVDGKLMILTAHSRSNNRGYIDTKNNVKKVDTNIVQPLSVIPTLTDDNIDTISNPAIDAQISEVMRRAQADGATATIGLVGLPCEIPLGAYLYVDARYNQSKSYTSGVYMIKNATTFINDSGIFSTDINLFKVLRYTDTYKNQEETKKNDSSTEKEFDKESTKISKVDWEKEGMPERNPYSGSVLA